MTEHDEQTAVMDWYRSVGCHRWPELWITSNPNAAKMSYGAAAYMRAEGRTAGMPDLSVHVQRGGYGALHIEMKYGKGRLSDVQKAAIKRLIDNGYRVAVCYSSTEAIRVITDYMAQ
jgi:hypothetical protein